MTGKGACGFMGMGNVEMFDISSRSQTGDDLRARAHQMYVAMLRLGRRGGVFMPAESAGSRAGG